MQFNHDWLHFFLTASYTGGEKTVNDNLSIHDLVFSTLLNNEQVSLISSALITDPQNFYGLHKDVAECGWIRTNVCLQDLLLQATVFVVGAPRQQSIIRLYDWVFIVQGYFDCF